MRNIAESYLGKFEFDVVDIILVCASFASIVSALFVGVEFVVASVLLVGFHALGSILVSLAIVIVASLRGGMRHVQKRTRKLCDDDEVLFPKDRQPPQSLIYIMHFGEMSLAVQFSYLIARAVLSVCPSLDISLSVMAILGGALYASCSLVFTVRDMFAVMAK